MALSRAADALTSFAVSYLSFFGLVCFQLVNMLLEKDIPKLTLLLMINLVDLREFQSLSNPLKGIRVEKARLRNTPIYILLKMKRAFSFQTTQFVWLNVLMKRALGSHALRITMEKKDIVKILKPTPPSLVIIVRILMSLFFLRL